MPYVFRQVQCMCIYLIISIYIIVLCQFSDESSNLLTETTPTLTKTAGELALSWTEHINYINTIFFYIVPPAAILLRADGGGQRASVTASDLRTVSEGQWLNDQVVSMQCP